MIDIFKKWIESIKLLLLNFQHLKWYIKNTICVKEEQIYMSLQ